MHIGLIPATGRSPGKEHGNPPSMLAWIPWTEEPGRQQSMGSHRVRHWNQSACKHTILYSARTKRVVLASHLDIIRAWHFATPVRTLDKYYVFIPPVVYILDICPPSVYVQETSGRGHWERKIFIAALFIKDCTSPKCPVNGEKEKIFLYPFIQWNTIQ